MKLRFPERQIRVLAERYSYPRQEQALLALRPQIQRAGCLTIEQLKQVALWKAPRVAGHVDRNDPDYVREVTAWSFSAKTERARIESLTLVDGVQWPTASVILHLYHPEPYPILDFRALWSVGLEVPDQYSFSFWWPYVELCRTIAERNGVDMRTLDRALWQHSKENQLGERRVETSQAARAHDAPSSGSTGGSLAERIRAYAYERIVRPALDDGRSEVSIRAGDVHSAMGLQSRMPTVCSALESRKFSARYGLTLVGREGPARGANVFYRFRPNGASNGRPNELEPARRVPSTRPFSADERGDVRRTAYWISCVSQKRSRPAPAKDLYISDWFSKARSYVESKGSPWFVLSAKYGLVAPDEVIEPYELTLNTMGVGDRRQWADRVLSQLPEKLQDVDRVVLLAGMRYREFLEPRLQALGIDLRVPMRGLRIGEQLSWLGEHAR